MSTSHSWMCVSILLLAVLVGTHVPSARFGCSYVALHMPCRMVLRFSRVGVSITRLMELWHATRQPQKFQPLFQKHLQASQPDLFFPSKTNQKVPRQYSVFVETKRARVPLIFFFTATLQSSVKRPSRWAK